MLTPGKYAPKSPIRLTASFVDNNGTGIDPDTVTFRAKTHTGYDTSLTYGTDPEVGRSAAGQYYVDFTPQYSGHWFYRWETTGTNKTFAVEGKFNVQASKFEGCDYPGWDYR